MKEKTGESGASGGDRPLLRVADLTLQPTESCIVCGAASLRCRLDAQILSRPAIHIHDFEDSRPPSLSDRLRDDPIAMSADHDFPRHLHIVIGTTEADD